MKHSFNEKQEPSKYRRLIPYIALLVCLSLTIYTWRIWNNANTEREQRIYTRATDEIVHEINNELHNCMMVLKGAAAFFAVSEDVTRNKWRLNYEYRQISTLLPGVQGVGFSRVIRPSELARHIQGIRAEGFPDYTVRPAGERDVYTAIIFLEPFDARNRRTFGYDMFSEPVRRAAMERARDTGAVSISGMVKLAQETDKDVQAGFLMYVPTYAKGMPLNSVEERRVALQGYVYSPFRMDNLMRSVFPNDAKDVDFAIYDGAEVSLSTLMYDSHDSRNAPDKRRKPLFSSRKTIDLYGHQWTLAFDETRPSLETATDGHISGGILAAGFVISLLAFLFIRAQENTRKRAFSLAREMTYELRDSEDKYRTLNDSLPVGVSIIGPNMEILAANTTIHNWFPESDYKQHLLCYAAYNLPPRMEPCKGCPMVLTFQDGQVHTAEREVNTSRGMRLLFITTMPLTDRDGKVISVHETVEDITERKQAEDDRVARKAADEASRAKSAFVANMSHEIRTPLNAILGFAQVLERDPSLTPQQTEHVRTIGRSGTHLLKLINDILDMSKIEAGRTTLNEAAFCLHDLLDDLEMMFRSRADAKGLQLVAERDESVPRYVTADEGKLRQVLVNLMGNAVKFTETGGVAVRVRAEAITEKTVKGTEALRLVAEVEDTGPGIPDGDMDRLFDAFQQAEAGVKAGGTGLGLAISRKFVEMMGGKFTVTSHVGKGSCFRFEVLLEPAEEVAEREIPVSRRIVGLEPGSGPFRILVADDMPDNRSLLRTLLQPVGFEIAEATNGMEALEVFARWSPHAVLMDMRMPVMDGYEATRRLKSTEAGQVTPVIAVTASAFDDARKQVMAAGVDAYLRKPFRPEELFEVLEKCMGLRYVFADETDKTPGHPKTPPITPEALAVLPKELIQAMRQVVAEGDMARLTELIGQVEKVDSTTARNLRALADSYEYEKLGQWLEKGGSDNG